VAEITIRGVTAAPKYPSADSLEDIEGMLITKMMNYLQEKKAGDLKSTTRLMMVGATEAQNCTYAERELEEVFVFTMFTETEGILREFGTINPSDFLLIGCERSAPPGICYTYNFNTILSIGIMVQKLGLQAIFQVI